VELRVFGGHGVEQTAALLGISPRTVKRRWRFARAWLAHAIRERVDGAGAAGAAP
jgi:DNA-directed RNA polymerase specialized sigma24 family protein